MGGNNVVSRRLSKPRTNTSSSNLLSWSETPVEMSSSPIASSDMDYFGEQATTVSSQGERRSRRKSRTKLRAYLYGSSSHESSQSLSSDEEEEGQNSLAGAARGAKKRLSRTGSSIMQLSSAKASTNYLSSSSTPNLLTLDDPEESVRVADQIKERARLDRIAAQNHVTSPVDEDKHVDSVMAPLRRKSLYTPGIATRQSSDILRKPPPPQSIQSQADRDYYYNPAYPASSPLAQLAAMNHSTNGRDTPTIDVTHLGGLKLGTLRVTNGTASPVPQDTILALRHSSATPESNVPEDFQTASEGSDNEGRNTPRHEEHTLLATQSSSTIDRFVPANQATANLRQEEQERYRKRISSPFRHESPDRALAMANEYAAELDGSPFSYSETPISNEPPMPISRFEDEGMHLSSPQEPIVDSWKSMIDEAEPTGTGNGTREDAFSKLNGPSLTSRYSMSTEAVPKNDSGYCSNASLGAVQHGPPSREHSREAMPLPSALRSRAISGPREMPSIRSKQETHEFLMEPPPQLRPSFTVIPRYALGGSESNAKSTGALETISSIRTSARSPSQVLVRKLQKARPKSQPPPPVSTITVQGYGDLEHVFIPRVPSLIAARHAERLGQFPTLDHTFPSSEHVSVSRSSTLTQAYNIPIRFPSPANALESAATGFTNSHLHAESTNILPPKSEKSIAINDDEWADPGPVLNSDCSASGSGKQKKLQKRAIREQREAERRLAKEAKEHEKMLAKERKELEKRIKRDESKERSNRSRRSSWGRAKSSERQSCERDAKATISDFGTVTESLGGSPYDIARSAQTQPVSYAPRQTIWHPHQISTAMPRAKSMIGLEKAVAAESANARGRPRSQHIGRPIVPVDEAFAADDKIRGRKIHDRPQSLFINAPPVPALSAVDLKYHNLAWAQSQQRTRSASRPREEHPELASFADRDGLPSKSARPQSMFVGAPPVPALPSLQQVKEREAAMTKSRPQSLVIDSPNEGSPTSRRSTDAPMADLATQPHKSRMSKMAVPDLWTSGSLEKKSLKTLKPSEAPLRPGISNVDDDDTSSGENIWDAQRQAWKERRKSAGETLFLKNQLKDILKPEDALASAAPVQKPRPFSTITRSDKVDVSDLNVAKRTTRPGPRPLAPHSTNPAPIPRPQDSFNQQPSYESYEGQTQSFPSPAERRAQQSRSYRIPRKRVGSGGPTSRSTSQNRASMAIPATAPPIPASTLPVSAAADTSIETVSPLISQLMGRYEGGLLYGYETGQGLGGSAGTRGAKTAASRKSVQVSKGYGIDLSDVPIFVAPAHATQ